MHDVIHYSFFVTVESVAHKTDGYSGSMFTAGSISLRYVELMSNQRFLFWRRRVCGASELLTWVLSQNMLRRPSEMRYASTPTEPM